MIAILDNCLPFLRTIQVKPSNPTIHAWRALSKSEDSPKKRYKYNARRTHLGGRGCACAPAFFLYYYHPPHNFFCNIAPFMGRCLRMVIMGCKSHATHTPKPPTQHGLGSRVCVCSLEGKCAWLLCGYQAGDESDQGNT